MNKELTNFEIVPAIFGTKRQIVNRYQVLFSSKMSPCLTEGAPVDEGEEDADQLHKQNAPDADAVLKYRFDGWLLGRANG